VRPARRLPSSGRLSATTASAASRALKIKLPSWSWQYETLRAAGCYHRGMRNTLRILGKESEIHVATDHAGSDHRIALESAALVWLTTLRPT
jgi:hypothetical protein